MHLNKVTLYPEKFPTKDHYPFNLDFIQTTESLKFSSPVTFFVGEANDFAFDARAISGAG